MSRDEVTNRDEPRPAEPGGDLPLGEIQRRLEVFLVGQGFERVTILDLRPTGGGTSRRLWSFDAVLEGAGQVQRRGLIARGDPRGSHLGSISRAEEFRVLQIARREGIPVPEALWLCEDPRLVGSPFFVMERLEGETIPRPLLRSEGYSEARAVLPRQLAGALARMHRLDPDRLGLFSGGRGDEPPVVTALRHHQELFHRLALEPRPVLELALRWLWRNVPSHSESGLVHGDFRVGNFLYGREGIRAILDWELAHRGDPMEDISWLCLRTWRFGVDGKEAGGLCPLEDFLAAYESGGGPAVDRGTLRYWDVFANFRWAVITILQARNHLDGFHRDVELAAIGRRAAENELDLLELIETA